MLEASLPQGLGALPGEDRYLLHTRGHFCEASATFPGPLLALHVHNFRRRDIKLGIILERRKLRPKVTARMGFKPPGLAPPPPPFWGATLCVEERGRPKRETRSFPRTLVCADSFVVR